MNKNIGKEILTKRKEKGLTQADVAARFGISAQAVSKWERGFSKPKGEIIDLLADYLGLDVERLTAEKKRPWFIRFISNFYYEIIKTVCVGVMMAGVVCIFLRFISAETAITSIGAATSVFCFATLLKRT